MLCWQMDPIGVNCGVCECMHICVCLLSIQGNRQRVYQALFLQGTALGWGQEGMY